MENNGPSPITPLAHHLASWPLKIGYWKSEGYPDGIIVEENRPNGGYLAGVKNGVGDADTLLEILRVESQDGESLIDTWKRRHAGNPNTHVYQYPTGFRNEEAEEYESLDGEALHIVFDAPLSEWEKEEREELEREEGPLTTDCEEYGCINHPRS